MSGGYDFDEKENIDDLLDYYDNENSKNNYESQDEDSFNDDILKLDQKHKSSNNLNNAQTNNRPISSYHRNVLSSEVNSDNINNKNVNISEVNSNELIQKLSDFIKIKKISKRDFCDNPNLYLDINDFKDLFNKINFEITKSEYNFLFQHKNPNIDEGYILIQSFYDNFPINWLDNNIENKEDVKEISSLSKINTEFKSLQDEIMLIVKKEEDRATSSKKFISNTYSNISNLRMGSSKSKPKLSAIQRPYTTVDNNKPENINNTIEFKPVKMKKFLIETTRKKQAEEEMLRVTLEKRNKENEKEFLRKITEANQICIELQIQRAFSAFIDTYGGLMCKIYNKDTNETVEIDYKKFLIEIRKLKKLKEQREEAKMWQLENKVEATKNKSKEKDNIKSGKLVRKDRQEEIKRILLESIISKDKLKRQLRALRDKKIKDGKLISDNLKLTNLDDNNQSVI